ncbi:NusG domain II-containing protein [Clostridiaceae bacterium M8S5]|nr:NusG domain II-containing protein [Clostridiaceae bacterium M8S5]
MKKLDIIIVIAVIFVAGLFYIVNNLINSDYDFNIVKITVDGKLYREIKLKDNNNEKIVIEKNGHKNIIDITGNEVRMIQANCSDKVCIKMGAISEPGEMIVCLPNKVIIEIQGDKKKDIDGLTY